MLVGQSWRVLGGRAEVVGVGMFVELSFFRVDGRSWLGSGFLMEIGNRLICCFCESWNVGDSLKVVSRRLSRKVTITCTCAKRLLK